MDVVHSTSEAKTLAQGARDILASSQGAWMYDKHLRGIVWDCFASSSTFNFLQLEMGESVYSRRLAELAVSILGNRAWSLAVRNHAPPECYVGLLSKHVDKDKMLLSRCVRISKN